MSRFSTHWILLLLFVCPLSGCSKTVVVRYKPVYYNAIKSSTVQFAQSGKNTQAPDAYVRKLFRQKKPTVGFFPPPSCARQRPVQGGSLLGECNALMTRLENKAANAGFQVLSWRLLRSQRDPVLFAKQRKVNFLFEVRKYSKSALSVGKEVGVRLSFSRSSQRTVWRSQSLRVTRSLALRCKRYLDRKQSPRLERKVAALQINVIDVQNTRVLWRYKREGGVSGQKPPVVRVQDTWLGRRGGVARRTTKKELSTFGMLWGGMMSVGGVTFFIVSGAFGGERALDIAGLAFLGAGLGIGGLLFVIGERTFRPKKPRVPRVLPPSAVMCANRGLGARMGQSRGRRRPRGARHRYSFAQKNATGTRKRRKSLDDVMNRFVDDFFTSLK